jgi:hypothetical protein
MRHLPQEKSETCQDASTLVLPELPSGTETMNKKITEFPVCHFTICLCVDFAYNWLPESKFHPEAL